MAKNSFYEKTYVKITHWIASMRQFQYVPTTYVTENQEENYLEIFIFQVSCPLSLPLLNISNCQSVLEYLSLYCKLFMFVWQLHVYQSLQIQFQELPLC